MQAAEQPFRFDRLRRYIYSYIALGACENAGVAGLSGRSFPIQANRAHRQEQQELLLVGVWINPAILPFLDVIKPPTEQYPDRPRLEVRAELCYRNA
jgi:hypothetical protein